MEKQRSIKKGVQSPVVERGVQLEVFGRAIIAQADERIKWHKQMASTMTAELKAMMPSDTPDSAEGANAVLDGGPAWTVVVLSNLDPPTANRLAPALARALNPPGRARR